MIFYTVWSYNNQIESMFNAELTAYFIDKQKAEDYANEQEKLVGYRYFVVDSEFNDSEDYESVVCIKKRDLEC